MPYDEAGEYVTVAEIAARHESDELPVCGVCGEGIRRRNHPTFGWEWVHEVDERRSGHFAELKRGDTGVDR